MRGIVSILLVLCLGPVAAGVDLRTQMVDVRDSCDQAGMISFVINDNDFAGASPESPIYLRLALNQGVVLCNTLVDLEGSSKGHDPILLPLKLDGGLPTNYVAAADDAIAIVRWREGESVIWLAVSQSSSLWIGNDNLPPNSPSFITKMMFSIGLTARVADMAHISSDEDGSANANLPYPRRASGGDAVSTLLCVNAADSELMPSPENGTVSNLKFYPSSWQNSEGVTTESDQTAISFGAQQLVGFSNDSVIARRFQPDSCAMTFPAALKLQTVDRLGAISAQANRIRYAPGCPSGVNAGSELQISVAQDLNRGFEVAIDKNGEPVPAGTGMALVSGSVELGTDWENVIGSSQDLFQLNGVWVTRSVSSRFVGVGQIGKTFSVDLTTLLGEDDSETGRFLFTINATQYDTIWDSAPYDGPDQQKVCEQGVVISSEMVTLGGGTAVISEVIFNPGDGQYVAELENRGDSAIDLSGWWFCNRPRYGQLGSNRILAAGSAVTVHLTTGVDTDTDWFLSAAIPLGLTGELALYVDNSFGSSNSIRSYVQWGAPNQGRVDVAVNAGLWTDTALFMDLVDTDHSIELMPGVSVPLEPCDWLDQPTPTLGSANTATGDVIYQDGLSTWPDGTVLDLISILCRTTVVETAGVNPAKIVANHRGGK